MLTAELTVDYPGRPGVLRGARVEISPGEVLGLVGESGSGKSTLALAILGLLDYAGARVSGRAALLGRELINVSERQLREVRGRLVSLIPQSPSTALNPVLRIETQMKEAWRAHSKEPWSTQRRRVAGLMQSAGLSPPDAFLNRRPGEISVGQAQRALIVMALLHSPALVIADEPTSALDVITQRDILDLLARLAAEQQMSLLLVSHDLGTVATVCQRVAILYGGQIVECGAVREVLGAPRHAYTQQLVSAVPKWKWTEVK